MRVFSYISHSLQHGLTAYIAWCRNKFAAYRYKALQCVYKSNASIVVCFQPTIFPPISLYRYGQHIKGGKALWYLLFEILNFLVCDNMRVIVAPAIRIWPFYTPVWKTGRIMPWQCPSVRLSVRPSVRVFRTFLQHALRYQFETRYIHSVGGTTCRVMRLQPKVDQTHFLQSWPQKSR